MKGRETRRIATEKPPCSSSKVHDACMCSTNNCISSLSHTTSYHIRTVWCYLTGIQRAGQSTYICVESNDYSHLGKFFFLLSISPSFSSLFIHSRITLSVSGCYVRCYYQKTFSITERWPNFPNAAPQLTDSTAC